MRAGHAQRRRWRRCLRWSVAAVALLHIGLALPDLFAGHGHSLHASREGASFDIAVAVGFLFAARHPERARALVPITVVLARCLAITSGVDIAYASTTVAHELGYGLMVLQAALLWALSRASGWSRAPRTVAT